MTRNELMRTLGDLETAINTCAMLGMDSTHSALERCASVLRESLGMPDVLVQNAALTGENMDLLQRLKNADSLAARYRSIRDPNLSMRPDKAAALRDLLDCVRTTNAEG